MIAVGRIAKQKNYELMITAMTKVLKAYPSVVLDIFGCDEERLQHDLQEMVDSNGMHGRIVFCGRSKNIFQEYLKHDIFLLSSDYEGVPNSLLEAMACKLVCVSTNCRTGPEDLIENGINGYLVPLNNSEAFADTVLSALQMSKESRAIMGNNARIKVLSYCSAESSIQTLNELFLL